MGATTITARQEGLGETSQALVDTAAEYFFDEKYDYTDDTEEDFREQVRAYLQKDPLTNGVAFASGLIAAGFEVEVSPVRVTVPEQEPMASLDTYAFIKNWRNVVGTVLAMGVSGLDERYGTHDEDTKQFLVGPVAEAIDGEVG